ncbi:MAG TPA: ABC transporter substrate-binding protein [Ferrovibrio sp.]|jgi:branched-chain amino acid transport system substrate-binding protein|uniref:ABC transporter substrate-binding protein n=1 Tax=Ferrovibrio sp. TaxID=1917215 RepID=UPI002B4B148F|nr:ABC transporter substrate-binding protein [Ferrovibrio sp.]HLT77801.1 ABC transporter substrate-binding protein [Ferrovibrio sp.]
MRIRSLAFSAALLAAAGLAGTASAQNVRGVTKSEIVIGMHTDLSGVAASYGVSSSNAMRLQFEKINAEGGIHGRKIRLIVEDSQYQVPRAVQAANKLINRDKIFIMAGALGTPHNAAVFEEQFKAGIPNVNPVTAARSMVEPHHPLKFQTISSYYDHIRAGIKYVVEKNGRKKICTLYQDTDFGKETLEGVQDQVKAMNLPLVETATNKPTDTDFTAQITKLRNAGCDLVALGAIVRDAILSYATARKMGWNDVDFVSQSASFDQIVASAPGGVTEGMYVGAGTVMPYRDTADATVAAWWDAYKAKYGADPNIGAVYGTNTANLIITALEKAGKDLTTEKFVKALESISGYRDIFGGPVVNFGPDKHLGTNEVLLYQIQKGRFVKIAGPLRY